MSAHRLCRHTSEASMRARMLAIVLALCAACSGGNTAKSAADRDSLTERQRDSILAKSRIPGASGDPRLRSEEHTSELQSQSNLVCRLLLAKKKHYAYTLLPIDVSTLGPPP